MKIQDFAFQGRSMKILLLNRMTDFFNVEKLKLENHFFEMITATVSHDMRTPINSILGIT